MAFKAANIFLDSSTDTVGSASPQWRLFADLAGTLRRVV